MKKVLLTDFGFKTQGDAICNLKYSHISEVEIRHLSARVFMAT